MKQYMIEGFTSLLCCCNKNNKIINYLLLSLEVCKIDRSQLLSNSLSVTEMSSFLILKFSSIGQSNYFISFVSLSGRFILIPFMLVSTSSLYVMVITGIPSSSNFFHVFWRMPFL